MGAIKGLTRCTQRESKMCAYGRLANDASRRTVSLATATTTNAMATYIGPYQQSLLPSQRHRSRPRWPAPLSNERRERN